MSAPPDLTSERDVRLLATLARLTEIGMSLAEALEREVVNADAPVSSDFAIRFSRIARAVRQSVALEHRLARALAEEAAPDNAGVAIAAAFEREKRGMAGYQRKVAVADLVAAAIEDEFEEDSDERKDAWERLDGFAEPAEHDALYLDRPAGDIVIDICRGLGIIPPDGPDFDRAAWEDTVRRRYAAYDLAPAATLPPDDTGANAPPLTGDPPPFPWRPGDAHAPTSPIPPF